MLNLIKPTVLLLLVSFPTIVLAQNLEAVQGNSTQSNEYTESVDVIKSASDVYQPEMNVKSDVSLIKTTSTESNEEVKHSSPVRKRFRVFQMPENPVWMQPNRKYKENSISEKQNKSLNIKRKIKQ